jgi:hypothetical protein
VLKEVRRTNSISNIEISHDGRGDAGEDVGVKGFMHTELNSWGTRAGLGLWLDSNPTQVQLKERDDGVGPAISERKRERKGKKLDTRGKRSLEREF